MIRRPSRHFTKGIPVYPAFPGPAGPLPWAPGWVFYFGFYLTLISVMAILRRQWAERERLVYPISQVPLAMIQEGKTAGLIKPFFKSGIMWCGFAIPLCNPSDSL